MTRREHIVPSSYLANFCNDDGRLFVYGKHQNVRESRPQNECFERDFYEYEISGKKTGNAYENWLENIEGNGAQVLRHLVDGGKLDRTQAFMWSCFVASLFVRTRKARAQLSPAMIQRFRAQSQQPEFVRELQYRLLQAGELRDFAGLQDEIDSRRTAMEGSASYYHVVSIPPATRALAESIRQKRWHAICAPEGQCFITSDCPVVTVEGNTVNFGVGIGEPDTVIYLPVTQRVLFVASPPRFTWHKVFDPEDVEKINRAVARFAERNVYASIRTDDLRALVDQEINRVIFGQNAFLSPEIRWSPS